MKVQVSSNAKTIVRFVFLFVTIFFSLAANAVELVSAPDDSTFVPSVSGGGDSYVPVISPDGRYVLFNSTANNLARRTNNMAYIAVIPAKLNVFLRDRVLGSTTLVSVDPGDSKSGEDDSMPSAVSTNGQYVLFESTSSVVAGDATNQLHQSEIYLRDVVNKTTALVSVRMSSAVTSAATDSTMTPDGRFVAFSSSDPNFVPDDTNSVSDIFVRDMALGQTRLVSGGISDHSFTAPEITPDGKFVTFIGTKMTGFYPTQEVYVCDLGKTNTFCVSTNSQKFFTDPPVRYGQKISDDGKYVVHQTNPSYVAPGITEAVVLRHNNQTGADDVITTHAVPTTTTPLSISPDGRFVAFVGKTNTSNGILLWDGQTKTTALVSANTNGVVAFPTSLNTPTVDASGRFVAFAGYANDLVTNSVGYLLEHIYRRDMQNGVTELMDVGTNGNAANRQISSEFAMSGDGHFIAFDSSDSDLVASDGNNASDIFMRDTASKTTELVSMADPVLATKASGMRNKRSHVRVNADGRYAIFAADGADVVPGCTNHFFNIFGRDLINHSNFIVSVDTNGLGNADRASIEPSVSADGRYVVFTSFADNLVRNDTNRQSDVFLRDLQTGTTVLVSTNGAGPGSPNGASFSPAINSGSRYVMYFSAAKNIVPLPASAATNLFVYDRTLRTNYAVTTNGALCAAMTLDGHYVAFCGAGTSSGVTNLYVWDSQTAKLVFTNSPVLNNISTIAVSTNGQRLACIAGSVSVATLRIVDCQTRSNITVSVLRSSPHANPHLSGDGQFLVYATSASNSLPDVNASRDVYVFDYQTRSNTLISRSFVTGQSAAGNSDSPDLSADGRYITYESDASDIVPSDDNHSKDIFLFDRQSGSTMLLSAGIYGDSTADYESQAPGFTADGQTVAFQSWASDIAENDFNQGSDLFLLKIVSPIGSTNPPPVFTGQLILYPGSIGSGPVQTSPQLTWAAAPGVGYQVEYKTNLTDGGWLPVNGSVVIENGQGYVKDLSPDPDHRFYRIVGF